MYDYQVIIFYQLATTGVDNCALSLSANIKHNNYTYMQLNELN